MNLLKTGSVETLSAVYFEKDDSQHSVPHLVKNPPLATSIEFLIVTCVRMRAVQRNSQIEMRSSFNPLAFLVRFREVKNSLTSHEYEVL
jgi:hypothetical protein